MTRLKERLARMIAAAGPIGIADYMAACLFDPVDGYYTTREPFGAEGDFTTAPEISQMFGELVAVWCVGAWEALGRPAPFCLAEIGPGRGTLMQDMMRTIARLSPDMLRAAEVAMVEASPHLAAVQERTLADAPKRPSWLERPQDLPRLPLVVVANELFDAIPLRQYVMGSKIWHERMVGLDEAGDLAFVAGPGAPPPGAVPPGPAPAPGTVLEVAPARAAMMDVLCERIAADGGAGLFIDYGYTGPAYGDTLQALRRHEYDPVLANPGEADLTAHVDFGALAEAAHGHGLAARLLDQGEFLMRMGLAERASALGRNAPAERRERLQSEVDRLARPEAMGTLFKVLAVARPGAELPGFSSAD